MSVWRKIEELSGWKWILFCILFFIVLQLLLHPAILNTTILYAEDGTVFINDYLKNGLTSFIKPFGGYLVFISRLAAFLGVTVGQITNSFSAIGETIEVFAMLFVAVVCAYFASESFSWISKKKHIRILNGSALLLLVSCFHMMLYNSVDLHWWCGIFAFLASINIIRGEKIQPAWLTILTLCLLSTPSAFVVALPVLYSIFSKHREKSISTCIVSLSCLAIQAIIIVFLSDLESGGSLSAWGLLRTVRYIIELTLGAPLFIFGPQAFHFTMANGLGVVLGGVCWILLCYALKAKCSQNVFWLSIINIMLLYFMVLFKRSSHIDAEYISLTDSWYNIFYNVIPAVICFILFIIAFWANTAPLLNKLCSERRQKKTPNAKVLTVVLLLLVTSYYFNTYSDHGVLDLTRNDNYKEIDEYTDYSSKHYAKVNILPYWNEDWTVYVPVDDEYCLENGCYEEIEVGKAK